MITTNAGVADFQVEIETRETRSDVFERHSDRTNLAFILSGTLPIQ